MGEGKHYSSGTVRLTESQRNRIKPNYAYSEWYYVVDKVTGAKKKLRKKIKQDQRRRRSK